MHLQNPITTNQLDPLLLRGSGEEYFPAWIKKHRPDLVAKPRAAKRRARKRARPGRDVYTGSKV